ncbi:dTMP kinase, partial [Arthrospira sp. O9.13F]
LYAADRAQHIETLIKPLLDQGTIILCDRFTDSTLAYQGYGRGLDLQQIHQINQIATGGVVPDLTLWLNVPVEAGLTRIKARKKVDRIEQADLEFHYRVAEGFATLAKMYPQRIVPIDGNGDRDRVTQQIQNILNQKLLEWGLISNNYGCV